MKRRDIRPTSFFKNFNFRCNFEEPFDLDVENISNLLFFVVPEMANVLLTTTLLQYSLSCCLPSTLIL